MAPTSSISPSYPTMTFQSTSVAASGDGYALTGDLTIKGVTLPITFDTTFNGSETFPVDGSTHYGFSASANDQPHRVRHERA